MFFLLAGRIPLQPVFYTLLQINLAFAVMTLPSSMASITATNGLLYEGGVAPNLAPARVKAAAAMRTTSNFNSGVGLMVPEMMPVMAYAGTNRFSAAYGLAGYS